MKFGFPHEATTIFQVSTLVVEWIEITQMLNAADRHPVSTLVVEWIEITQRKGALCAVNGLHPRGGVD